MQKSIVQAGFLGLVSMALTISVLGQKEDSSAHSMFLNDSRYSARIEGDKVVELSVDGRKIPADSFAFYDPVVRKLMARAAADKLQAERDREQAERDRGQAGRDRDQAERDRGQALGDKEQAEKARMQADRDRQQADKDKVQAEQDRMQAERDKAEAERDRRQAGLDRKMAAEDSALLQQMIAAIVEDGLALDKKSVLAITLNADEFILNGKPQPDSIHKKYAAKYLVKSGYSISFHTNR